MKLVEAKKGQSIFNSACAAIEIGIRRRVARPVLTENLSWRILAVVRMDEAYGHRRGVFPEMRGNVLATPGADKLGVISGDDGQRYSFSDDDLQGAAVRLGQTVDFVAQDGDASEIYPVLGRVASSVPAVAGAFAQRDWAAFYFSPSGRVGRGDYWLFGVLALLIVDAVLGLIPGLNAIAFLVTGWCGLALLIKRCHDVGRSGWWSLIAFVPQLVLFVAIPTALVSNHRGGAAILAAVVSLAAIVWFIVSVLVKVGDQGPNRFGPSPEAAQA